MIVKVGSCSQPWFSPAFKNNNFWATHQINKNKILGTGTQASKVSSSGDSRALQEIENHCVE